MTDSSHREADTSVPIDGGEEPVVAREVGTEKQALPHTEKLHDRLTMVVPEDRLQLRFDAGFVSASSPRIASAGRMLQQTLRERLHTGSDDFQFRDTENLHITAITAREGDTIVEGLCEELRLESTDKTVSKPLLRERARERLRTLMAEPPVNQEWTLAGIGTVQRGEDQAYFGVINWDGGGELRRRFAKYGVNPSAQDFHITLAVKGKDVHGVRKNVAQWTADGAQIPSSTPTPEDGVDPLALLDARLAAFDAVAPLVFAPNARRAITEEQNAIVHDPAMRLAVRERMALLENIQTTKAPLDAKQDSQLAQARFMLAEEKIDLVYRLRNRLSSAQVHPRLKTILATMIENDLVGAGRMLATETLEQISEILVNGAREKQTPVEISHALQGTGLPPGVAAYLCRETILKKAFVFEDIPSPPGRRAADTPAGLR